MMRNNHAVCCSEAELYSVIPSRWATRNLLLIALFLGAVSVFAREPVSGRFIRDWQICGPFPAANLLDPAVENEESLVAGFGRGAGGRPWKVLNAAADHVDFEAPEAFGLTNQVVAYAFAELESERDGDVILGLGSDDGVMAWWNGRQVLAHDVARGVKAGEDQVRLRMRQGRNTLLLKVFDAGGGWGFAADLRPAGAETWTWKVVPPKTTE